jgi:hypothetical protein
LKPQFSVSVSLAWYYSANQSLEPHTYINLPIFGPEGLHIHVLNNLYQNLHEKVYLKNNYINSILEDNVFYLERKTAKIQICINDCYVQISFKNTCVKTRKLSLYFQCLQFLCAE